MKRPYAMRYARFEAVEDFLRQGWMIAIPNAIMHHHHYGIELAWLCACPVPGGFHIEESSRVPLPPAERENGSPSH